MRWNIPYAAVASARAADEYAERVIFGQERDDVGESSASHRPDPSGADLLVEQPHHRHRIGHAVDTRQRHRAAPT